jgi:hypothetical protein
MILHRLSQTAHATFGQLADPEGVVLAVTLELPWQGNAHTVSCIPAGTYECRRYLSPKRKYELFELVGVPGRSHIELHIGNLPHDSQGCILIGTRFETINGQHGIAESAPAFRRFMEYLHGRDTFSLTIIDPSPDVVAT